MLGMTMCDCERVRWWVGFVGWEERRLGERVEDGIV